MKETFKQVPFAKFPKPLMTVPISNDAKLLYTLLSDRFQLSLKNGVTDEDGFPCCYYPNREICEALNCAHGKATKLLRELEQARMLYRRKVGRGKADCLYVGGISEDADEVCRFPAGRCADLELPGVPKIGSLECRFSAPSKKEDNKNDSIQTEESKERLSALIERLDLQSLFSPDAESGLHQMVEHIRIVMETEFPVLRVGGTDYPTEVVRDAFDRLTREDVKEILEDFLADSFAFGSMRARLFEAGCRHGLGNGTVSASNDSWAHEAACQGMEPLKPHETEDAS